MVIITFSACARVTVIVVVCVVYVSVTVLGATHLVMSLKYGSIRFLIWCVYFTENALFSSFGVNCFQSLPLRQVIDRQDEHRDSDGFF